MAHGYPDWGQTSGTTTTYKNTDMAELAARLGSIVTFDRRGDVIFMDDFENGLKRWNSYLYGAGAAISQSTLKVRNGNFSAKLTTGSDGDRAALLQRQSPYPVLSKLGIEVSTNLVAADVWVEILIGTPPYPGNTVGRVRYNYGQDRLEYQDSNGNWQLLASGLNPYVDPIHFHTFKLVIDLINKKYAYLIFDHLIYDLSSYTLAPNPFAVSLCLITNLYIQSIPAANYNVYFDAVIITQNEP